MSETNEDVQDSQEQMSPEEYKKARNAATLELKEEIKYLKVEEQYQKLQADIEEHKARRLTMIQRQAQLMYGGQQQAPKENQEQAPHNHKAPQEQPFAEKKPAAEKKPSQKRQLKKD